MARYGILRNSLKIYSPKGALQGLSLGLKGSQYAKLKLFPLNIPLLSVRSLHIVPAQFGPSTVPTPPG